MSTHLYDVVAVNIETSKVRIMDARMDKENAEAYIKFAIMRRGLDEEFYADVPTGAYAEGETWDGKRG